MAIIVKDNFLDQKLIDTIATEIKTKIQSSEAVWATSHSWEGIVVEGSNSTNMSPLKNGVHELRQKFVNLNPFYSGLQFEAFIYLWNRNSMLDWHDDSGYVASGTIYLNQYWDSADGGLFLYKEDEQILAQEPKFNRLVLNDNRKNATMHSVSAITPWAKQTRVTIQARFK
jgi:hypothetical protein|tara:strand:- start:533 stop:1045 length:513 start_codon:yes stop_codon:yes gene_type:complete